MEFTFLDKSIHIENNLYNELIKLGFENSNYRNDTCGSFCLDYNFGEMELKLFVDFDHFEQKEDPELPKYFLHLNGEHQIHSNDPTEITDLLDEYVEKFNKLIELKEVK